MAWVTRQLFTDFYVPLNLLATRITAVLASQHVHAPDEVSAEPDTDWAPRRPGLQWRCFPSVLEVYGMFLGCVFLLRVLSKHWRCFALLLRSGCEVFVTVATPTPSVMARRAYAAARVRTRV